MYTNTCSKFRFAGIMASGVKVLFQASFQKDRLSFREDARSAVIILTPRTTGLATGRTISCSSVCAVSVAIKQRKLEIEATALNAKMESKSWSNLPCVFCDRARPE